MSPEPPVQPKIKETLKNQTTSKQTNAHTDGGKFKGLKSQLKDTQWLKLEQFKQPDKVVLNFNPKYTINIHESHKFND